MHSNQLQLSSSLTDLSSEYNGTLLSTENRRSVASLSKSTVVLKLSVQSRFIVKTLDVNG